MDIKSLLDEIVYEMETVFEHGLTNSSGFSDRFYMFAGAMLEIGMEQGGKLCKIVADSFNQSRFETNARSTEVFAELWKYLILCRDRLEYYNIKITLDL